MDGFSYTDIFATKGVEYLVIIAFLILLIPFWVLLGKQPKLSRQIQKTRRNLTASLRAIPQGLYFSENHTWAFLEKSGRAKIGIDYLLVRLTGEMALEPVRKPGEAIEKGDLLTEISHDGKKLKIFAPVSGAIEAYNPDMSSSVYSDPYGNGWVCRIKPSNWIEETQNCYVGEKASTFIGDELARFRDFLSKTMPNYPPEMAMVILQDGGEISDQALDNLPQEVWSNFEKEFLQLS